MADEIGNLVSNMDNMSLEDIGSSLLSRQARLNAEAAKEAKKQARIQNVLGLLGVGIAITKDAKKRRLAELEEKKVWERGDDEAQASQFRTNAEAVKHFVDLDNLNVWEGEDYLNFKADPKALKFYYGDTDISELSESQFRSAYLHDSDRIGNIALQFRTPFDEALKKKMSPSRYDEFVGSKDYEKVLELHGMDIANHYYKNVAKEGEAYRPQYENFIDNGLELFNLKGPDRDKSAEEFLRRAQGITPMGVSRVEAAYIDRWGVQNYDKGLIGGVIDGARKLGAWSDDTTPNMFESASKADWLFNRDPLEGKFEMNLSSVVYDSVNNRLQQFESNTLPGLSQESILELELAVDEDYVPYTQYDDYKESGLLSDKNFVYKALFGNRSREEVTESALVHMSVPTHEGENQTHKGLGWRKIWWRAARYSEDLGEVELKAFHTDTTKLAIAMELEPKKWRQIYGNMVGTLDGFETHDEVAMAEYDRFASDEQGRIIIASRMLMREGFYSEGGVGIAEGYDFETDTVDRFDKYSVPRGYNTHNSIMANAENNYIYVDKDGWHINNDVKGDGSGGWDELSPQKKAQVWHTTLMNIGNIEVENQVDLVDIYSEFTQSIPHPIMGNVDVNQYQRWLADDSARAVIFGADLGPDYNMPVDKWSEVMNKRGTTTIGGYSTGSYYFPSSTVDKTLGSTRNRFSRREYLDRIKMIKDYGTLEAPEVAGVAEVEAEDTNSLPPETLDFIPAEWANVTKAEVFGVNIEDSPLYNENTREELSNYGDRMNNVFVAGGFAPIPFDDVAMKKTDRILGFIASTESGGTTNPLIATNPDSTAKGVFQITDGTAKTAIVRLVNNSKFGDYEVPDDIQVLYDEIMDEGLEYMNILRLSPTSQTLLAFSNLIERPVSIDGVKQDGLGTELMWNYYNAEPGSIQEAIAAEKIYSLTHHTDATNENMSLLEKARYSVGKNDNVERNLRKYYPAWNDFQNKRYNTKKD